MHCVALLNSPKHFLLRCTLIVVVDADGGEGTGATAVQHDSVREHVERILRGEITAAKLSRELGVARSLIQRRKYLLTKVGETAVAWDGDVAPASALRAAQERIRQLERALGRKAI